MVGAADIGRIMGYKSVVCICIIIEIEEKLVFFAICIIFSIIYFADVLFQYYVPSNPNGHIM